MFTTYGIRELGSFLMGASPTSPDYMVFSETETAITGAEALTGNEAVRKTLTWRWNGTTPEFESILSTLDAPGSIIRKIGLVTGITEDAGSLYTFDESTIGSKDGTFNVTVTGQVRLSRR